MKFCCSVYSPHNRNSFELLCNELGQKHNYLLFRLFTKKLKSKTKYIPKYHKVYT